MLTTTTHYMSVLANAVQCLEKLREFYMQGSVDNEWIIGLDLSLVKLELTSKMSKFSSFKRNLAQVRLKFKLELSFKLGLVIK